MKLFRARFGIRASIGLVGLCALVFWAMRVSRDSRPAYLYSGWLIDGDDARRDHAAQELGTLDVEPEVTVPALIKAMRTDRSARVRRRSARSLADVLGRRHDGPTIEAATGPLVESLADPDPTVRTSAADTLGRIAPGPSEVLPALLRASGDEDEWVRGAAISAIGSIQNRAGIDQPEARRAIVEAIHDPSLHVRELGIYASWAVAAKSTGFSVALLKDDDVRARRAAMTTLARMSTLAGKVVLELTDALADPDDVVRAGAAKVLGGVRPLPEPAVLALRRARGDRVDAVREAARRALFEEP
jgi:HEAT repeat protein